MPSHDTLTTQKIRETAYARWDGHGRLPKNDLADWYAAEAVVDTVGSPPTLATKFIYLSNPRFNVNWPSAGTNFAVPIDGTETVLNVTAFRKVNILITSTNATNADLRMGQVSGNTACQSFPVAVDGKITTLEILGPEIQLQLYAKPGTAASKQAQLWLYLTS